MKPEHLRDLLAYDPETGAFTWLARPRGMFDSDRIHRGWNTKWAGKSALTNEQDGYLVGCLLGRKLRAHTAAWLIAHGQLPEGMQIDHINGDRADNRIANLRLVSPLENSRNRRVQPTNTSGKMGVGWVRKLNKWNARIGVNGRREVLGCFGTYEEAVAAREAAEKRLGYHPNHGRQGV